ncbi:MAG: hypothetical protein KDD85_03950 [Parvularculaceae bacterium]|nr:hypothetical protein [Parvularculaceae bacterium]
MNKLLVAAAAALAIGTAPAFASSTQDQISLCTSELSTQGLAPADQFRAKFVSLKGASLRTLKLKLIPVDGGDSKVAECRIKGDTVVEATIKS